MHYLRMSFGICADVTSFMQFCRKGIKIVDIVYTCTQPVGVYISFTLCTTTSYAFSARIRILVSTVHHVPFRVKAGAQYHTQQIKQKCLALLYLPESFTTFQVCM